MPNTWRVPAHIDPMCPRCQRDLTFVCSWTFRGLWGYNEVRTFECPEHGPVFVSPRTGVQRSERPSVTSTDDGDRDARVAARRKPRPTLNVDAIAIPEPDSD